MANFTKVYIIFNNSVELISPTFEVLSYTSHYEKFMHEIKFLKYHSKIFF